MKSIYDRLPTILSRKEIKANEKQLEKDWQKNKAYRAEEAEQADAELRAEEEYNERADAEEQKHLKSWYKARDKNYYNAHCDNPNWRW